LLEPCPNLLDHVFGLGVGTYGITALIFFKDDTHAPLRGEVEWNMRTVACGFRCAGDQR
jgi:hypothetical protein